MTKFGRSAQELGALDNDERAWRFAGNAATAFYAASYLYERTGSRRSWKVAAHPNHFDSDTARGIFLDQIALLFARAKSIIGDSYGDDKCPSTASANVTATAWGKHYTANGQKFVPIYIAKNHGPQTFDKWNDVEFAAQLQNWYSDLSADYESGDMFKDPIWALMQSFWVRRHRYYVDEIRKIYRKCQLKHKVALGISELPGDFADRLHQLNEPADRQLMPVRMTSEGIELFDKLRREHLQRDWKHLGSLMRLLSAYDTIEDDKLNDYVTTVCSHEYTFEKDYYKPGIETRKKHKLEEHFRKIIKHLRMLRTLKLVWDACVYLKSEYPDVHISFRFLLRQEMQPVPTKPLADLLQTWLNTKQHEYPDLLRAQGSAAKSVDKRAHGTLEERLEYTIDKLRQFPLLPRDFHAELQLLLMPYGVHYMLASDYVTGGDHPDQMAEYKTTENDIIHEYFGCSKLSCHSCWKALKHTGHATKNTHHRLHHGCAFPIDALPQFSKSSGENDLRRMAYKLEKTLLGQDLSETWEEEDHMTQTGTTDTRLLHLNSSVLKKANTDVLFVWELKTCLSSQAPQSESIQSGETKV